MKKAMKFAAFAAAVSLTFASCTSTSVMGLSKASYVDGELEKLDARTEEMDRLEDRFAELDDLSDKVEALDEDVADLNASVDEAERADEELRDLAEDFRDRLDGLSRETLQELVQVLMDHLEAGEE